MQPEEESTYPHDWLRIAEKDLQRVAFGLAGNDPDLAGFYLQQAVEKFLKAFLLSRGWRLRRIHDLVVLLDDASQYGAEVGSFRAACQEITKFYFVERYPLSSLGSLDDDEVRRSLHDVNGLIELLRELIL
jgi:HEPN domain-containing protein